MSNFKSLLVTFAFYTFSFACSGSTERTFTEENDAKEIESETLSGSYDSAIVPETNNTNDTNNSINDTGTNTTVDSGPLKNESGALIINGQCIPKTKYQIEVEYTEKMNQTTISTMSDKDKLSFGGYDQFIGCGVHLDGCGGTVDFGSDSCPVDPGAIDKTTKVPCHKIYQTGGFCKGTCGLYTKPITHYQPTEGCDNDSNIWLNFSSFGSVCLIRPRYVQNTCYWGASSIGITTIDNTFQTYHWCCRKI